MLSMFLGSFIYKEGILFEMQRKIIQQSATSVGMSLPAKWVKNQGLKAGDLLSVEVTDNELKIKSLESIKEIKEINIKIENKSEKAVRNLLVNAYRAGFDKLEVEFEGKIEVLKHVVKEHLLGFEMFRKGSHYIVESVAEPNVSGFEKILRKQLFIVLEIMRSVNGQINESDALRVQKYDNFLKRCLSKKIISIEALPFYWQFLSYITQISRQCYHLNRILRDTKKKLTKEEIEYMTECENMFLFIQKAYNSKDLKHLKTLHAIEKKLLYEDGPKLIKKHPLIMHYLMFLARLIYITNSPLTGALVINQLIKK